MQSRNREGSRMDLLISIRATMCDKWPLYLALWLLLLTATTFPVIADRMLSPNIPSLIRLPRLAGETGALRLAWSHDLGGSLMASNRASSLAQTPTLFHPWWWILAQIRRPLQGVAPDFIWATVTIIFAAAFTMSLRTLLRAVLVDSRTRTLAAALIVLGGGWRWFYYAGENLGIFGRSAFYHQFWSPPLTAIKQGTAFGGPLVSTWIAPERLALVATQALLLTCSVRACHAKSWRSAMINWLGAGLALTAAQPLSPAAFKIAAPAITFSVLFIATGRSKERGLRLRLLTGIPLVLGASWQMHRWYLDLPLKEPAWAHLWSHPTDLGVPPGFVLMALGTLAAGGLAWAVGRVAGTNSLLHPDVAVILYCWSLCGLLLPSIPVANLGVDVAVLAGLPLALLTADFLTVGLSSILSPRSHRIVVTLAILLNIPSIGAYAMAVIYELNTPVPARTGPDASVIAALQTRGSFNDLVLGNHEHLDRIILEATNKRTAGGWLTELRGHRNMLRREFFHDQAKLHRQTEILEALGVRFVLHVSGSGQPPHPSALLRKLATGDTLTLWEVQIPPFKPLPLKAGALLRDPFGQIYAYEGHRRHWIPNLSIFKSRGYEWEKVQHIGGWQLSTIPEGYPLALPSGKASGY